MIPYTCSAVNQLVSLFHEKNIIVETQLKDECNLFAYCRAHTRKKVQLEQFLGSKVSVNYSANKQDTLKFNHNTDITSQTASTNSYSSAALSKVMNKRHFPISKFESQKRSLYFIICDSMASYRTI